MKRASDHPVLWFVASVVFTLTVAAVLVLTRPARTVLAPGPCAMLGIAELADYPDAPFLVIDCEGFQFGVPAVLP